jgi:DNA polymerase-4
MPLEDEEFILEEFLKLLVGTHKRLVRSNYYTKTLTLKMRYEDRKIITRSRSLSITTQNFEILEELTKELFEEIEFDKKVKLIGINLGNLSKNKKQQLSFKKIEEIKKEAKISELKNEISKKLKK